MLKVAVVESKEVAKELIYDLQNILDQYEWSFHCYERLSALVNRENPESIDILVLPKRYHTQRVYHAIIEPNPNMIVICTCENTIDGLFDQILYINVDNIETELLANKASLLKKLKGRDILYFQYNSVRVALRITDILYIEKQEKSILYHTKRGLFKERGSIYQKEVFFQPYGFIRIHSSLLVNHQEISHIKDSLVVLKDQSELPISRSRKQDVIKSLYQ